MATPGTSAESVADSRALKGKRGLRRMINALGYSMDGLRTAWENEDAFRTEVVLAVVLAPVGWVLGTTPVDRALLIGVLLVVLIVEVLNTAIEAAIDRQGFEINPLAKRAKDLGSAAVFLALLLAGGIWLAVIWQRFL